uniref:Uncharacterized protein n=1 Tax=Triticum urartu TaxID=4572 RepID=A0A8R7UFT4_TRIUA
MFLAPCCHPHSQNQAMAGDIHHGSPAAAIFPYVVVAKYLLSLVYQLVLLASAAKPEPSSLEFLQPNTPMRSPDYDNDVQGTSPWVSRTSTWAPSSAMPGGPYMRSNGLRACRSVSLRGSSKLGRARGRW